MRTSLLTSVALLASQAAAQEAKGPTPVGSPAAWITPNDYPPSAIRAKAEGRVVTKLAVDAAGKVTSCKVDVSSGNAALDAATCAVMTTRAAFTPAVDASGEPVASTYTLPVRWALPSAPSPIDVAAPGAQLDTDIAVELSLDGEGKVVSCRVLSAKVPTQGDPVTINPCEPYAPGRPGGPALRRDGRPVASKVVQRLSRQVTADR